MIIKSKCMKDLKVCISLVKSEDKNDLINKIERMSGIYMNQMTSEVTHLVTDSVRTQKYLMAFRIGIIIVSKDWINQCWDEYQHQSRHANEPNIINEFKINDIFHEKPLLLSGHTISVSQFEIKERNRIKKIVENNGGIYSSALFPNIANTLLLLKEPKGLKFEYAIIKSIPCLDVKWIYKSVMYGKLLSKHQFIISLKKSPKPVITSIETNSRNHFRSDCLEFENNTFLNSTFESVPDNGLECINSYQSKEKLTEYQTKIDSKCHETNPNKIKDKLKLPEKIVVSQSTLQVLEKLNNSKKIVRTESHKSLGDDLNDKSFIVWNNRSDDGMPSQRPYNQRNEVQIHKSQSFEAFNHLEEEILFQNLEPMDISLI